MQSNCKITICMADDKLKINGIIETQDSNLSLGLVI